MATEIRRNMYSLAQFHLWLYMTRVMMTLGDFRVADVILYQFGFITYQSRLKFLKKVSREMGES